MSEPVTMPPTAWNTMMERRDVLHGLEFAGTLTEAQKAELKQIEASMDAEETAWNRMHHAGEEPLANDT